ncbi:MAG TPA: TlpA disulfide reductase family protein [Pirellulaceae bacterium]|nr:TlpA disulfide reductase family protein [Pirellulaceae bacterium]
MSKFCIHPLLVVSCLLVIQASGSSAADQDSGEQLLPANPAMWLNSPPLTSDTLKGKGVVLWFYEEQCPRCRERWPGMYDVAKKFDGKPVVFIAVNSGNPRDEVEQYAKGVKLPWPVIVDQSREFEKQWLDSEISLQNIHQLALILPDGRKQMANWNDFEGAVQKAAEGATWKIDPQTIPAAFQPTWRLVEMGKYDQAAAMVKKGLTTSNAEVKEAATRVHEFVQQELKKSAERAAKLRQEGDTWNAYQAYREIAASFAGYELPLEVSAAQKELAADEKVKQQLDAARALESIKKSFPTARTDIARKRIVRRLEQLVELFPDSEAAVEAKSILEQAAEQQQ